MKSVKSFINTLGKNYYPHFLTDPLDENVDYRKDWLLVKYKKKNYYEKSFISIKSRQEDIVFEIKELYEKALSQIYLKLSTADPKTFDTFINLNIEATKIKLKTLKSDFYVNSKGSRYFSTVIDNLEIENLSNRIVKVNDYPNNGSVLQLIENLEKEKNYSKFEPIKSIYHPEYHLERFKIISLLPLTLFHIGRRFIDELMNIHGMIQELYESKQMSTRIKWSGKKTHIGFILGTLAMEGYIDPPKAINGEVNYTAFAKVIKQQFEVDVSADTLRKYLNPDDDKFVENQKTFEKENFSIPHRKQVT